MRIGLFTDTYTPEINGAVSSVTMLCEGLRARGHDVWVVAPSNPEAPADEFQTIRVPSLPLIVLPERRFATPVEYGLMRRIKRLRLDIVHTNAEFAVCSFGFRAARRYHIGQVHTYHTLWEEYTHYVAPGVLSVPAKAAVRRLSAEICDRANRIIAPTAKTKSILLDYGVTRPVDVVPTGVDLARFSPVAAAVDPAAVAARVAALRAAVGADRFKVTLLSIGRVAPEKSVVELLLSLAPYLREHAEVCLLFVGGGPQLRELEKLAAGLALTDQVLFTGERPWSEVPDYYRLADVLVGNSSSETQGLTFIEALATGTPIVVRYNECFDGIIEDGVSGALITDDSQFIPALQAVLQEPTRSARIAAGTAVAARLSKETFAQTIEQTYTKILDSMR